MSFARRCYNGSGIEAFMHVPSDHLVTADELFHMRDDGFRYELVNGRLIKMSPPGVEHGVIVAKLGAALHDYVHRNILGIVVVESGYRLTTAPDTVRGPDISFVRRERIPHAGVPRAYWPGPPDLAVEVISPDDTQSETEAKIRQYLATGVLMVWEVDPGRRTVTVHRPGTTPRPLRQGDTLDGNDLLPGFRLPIADLFRTP